MAAFWELSQNNQDGKSYLPYLSYMPNLRQRDFHKFSFHKFHTTEVIYFEKIMWMPL